MSSPYSFSKTAMQAPSSLQTTIQNLITVPQFRVPNFIKILEQLNFTTPTKITSIDLTIQVKSPSKVEVLSVLLNSNGPMPSMDQMIQEIKTNIPKYFEKYPETINDVPRGQYVASYPIPVPEAGAANKQG